MNYKKNYDNRYSKRLFKSILLISIHFHVCYFLTLSIVKEERNAPNVAINPPKNAVFRIPSLSTKTPEIGDIKNVVPINSDPSNDDIVSDVLNPAFSYLSFITT